MTESFTSSSTWTGSVRSPAAQPLTVSVRTLGCKVNRVESERIAAELLGAQVEIVPEAQAAVIVVNTCAVTGEAEAKARKAVRHAAGLPHEPAVIVTGCASAVAEDRMRSLARRIVVENDKSRISERVLSLLGAKPSLTAAPVRVGEAFRTRAMVKIEDGCDSFCAYCIVPYARGVPTSTPLTEIVAEVAALAGAGVPEVVLTGINIGRYADGDADLAGVIRAVAATGVARIRISSIEPQDLTDELLDVMASTPAFLPHLHVPLQSGSDVVLRSMKRTYTVAEYRDRIAAARERIPGLAVTTDVIAGFPAEDEAAAAETVSVCEGIAFSKLHVFRYSVRSGTLAADMEQLPSETIATRAETLRRLGDRLAEASANACLGTDVRVLIEHANEESAEGTTGDYRKVVVRASGLRVGELVDVRVERREGAVLLSERL